jgi:hypothetical protein
VKSFALNDLPLRTATFGVLEQGPVFKGLDKQKAFEKASFAGGFKIPETHIKAEATPKETKGILRQSSHQGGSKYASKEDIMREMGILESTAPARENDFNSVHRFSSPPGTKNQLSHQVIGSLEENLQRLRSERDRALQVKFT